MEDSWRRSTTDDAVIMSRLATEERRGDSGLVCSSSSSSTSEVDHRVAPTSCQTQTSSTSVTTNVETFKTDSGGVGFLHGDLHMNVFIGTGSEPTQSITERLLAVPPPLQHLLGDRVSRPVEEDRVSSAGSSVDGDVVTTDYSGTALHTRIPTGRTDRRPDAGTTKDMGVSSRHPCSCWPWAVAVLFLLSVGSALVANQGESTSKTGGESVKLYIPPGSVEETTEIVTSRRESPRIIVRSQWMARPPTCVVDIYSPPARDVIVIHSATRGCSTEAECRLLVKSFQDYHIRKKKWCDISYNFLVGGDGNVYEGRGWDKVGSYTAGHNSESLGIAFIGDFEEQLPNHDQLVAFRRLIDVGVKTGKISEDYRLYAHSQLSNTESPGEALRNDSWPHFDKSSP